ncbi:hypothetical protein ACVWZB_004995, partial [Paenibacillus polymyxa]
PLSPPAPMVLGPQGPGRVGRCQATSKEDHDLTEIMVLFCITDLFIGHLNGSCHAFG